MNQRESCRILDFHNFNFHREQRCDDKCQKKIGKFDNNNISHNKSTGEEGKSGQSDLDVCQAQQEESQGATSGEGRHRRK